MRLLIVAIAGVLVALPAVAFAADAGAQVQVHLPHNVTVETDALTLGAMTIVQSSDPALQAKASAVAMGRAPWAREELVIDRPTIVARLAACGIVPAQVKLTGADRVVLTRTVQTMRGEELAKVAAEHLDRKCPLLQGGRWQIVRVPREVTVPAGGELLIEPRIASGDAASGSARVDVAVSQGGHPVATDQAQFKAVYPERRAVAVTDLPAGVTLTSENVEIKVYPSDRPEPADWKPPYGHAAAEAVKAGGVVRVAPARQGQGPAVEKIISRNDTVTMKIDGEGFTITALGLALDDGRAGGFVRVRNVDSGRIVVAKVRADGSVEPVVGGAKP